MKTILVFIFALFLSACATVKPYQFGRLNDRIMRLPSGSPNLAARSRALSASKENVSELGGGAGKNVCATCGS